MGLEQFLKKKSLPTQGLSLCLVCLVWSGHNICPIDAAHLKNKIKLVNLVPSNNICLGNVKTYAHYVVCQSVDALASRNCFAAWNNNNPAISILLHEDLLRSVRAANAGLGVPSPRSRQVPAPLLRDRRFPRRGSLFGPGHD